MSVWSIIEAIDDPSGLVHPERHQAFAKGTHPLAKHPAYPDFNPQPGEKGTNYEEILASRQWQKILQKAQQYLGVPLTRQALPVIQQKLQNALQVISDAESRNKEELEALAIELVFELPEYKSARAAYESNSIAIDAQLVDEIDTSNMMTSDDPEAAEAAQNAGAPPEQQQRTPEEKAWMGKMVQRRHFTNAMIQGSAVSNDYLFELAGQALDRIHPNLRKAYGVLMVATEIGYWLFPQSMVIKGARAKTHIGSAKIKMEQPEEVAPDEEQAEQPEQTEPAQPRPVVVASGQCFPVLIQEIIKGLTELASLPSLPRDAKDRQEVIDQADLVDLEAWHMMLGPKLWDSFIEATDAENERELTMHLYSHIQRMDVDQFNAFMKEVLAKSPRGMKMLRDLAAKIKQELAQDERGEFNESKKIVEELMDDEDSASWKEVTLAPQCPKIPRFEGDITGCGSTNVSGPDEEGFFDCLDCGLFFKQEAQDFVNENDEDDINWKELVRDEPLTDQGRYSQPFTGVRACTIESHVRRLGLAATEIGKGTFPDGEFDYVTAEFPEGTGQTSMTAKFTDTDSAESFLSYIYRIAEQRVA